MTAAVDLSRYQHVVWDWNGTLLDDVDLAVEVMNGLLGRRGMPLLTTESYRAVFDFPVRDYYERLGFNFAAESWAGVASEFIEAYSARWRECGLQRGAQDALERVATAAVGQSLLSAAHQEMLEAHVSHYGVAEHFAQSLGVSNWNALGKEDHARRWMAEQSFAPSSVLLIGDTVHDREVAREMGADCVLVAHGHQPRAKLERCGVPVYGSLGEMLDGR
jgi:phosphoglycolate phosphatase